jgi:ubiquinone/menaquinone biosynthesis C-methylase UbiE
VNRREYFDSAAGNWDWTHHRDTEDRIHHLIDSFDINRGENVADLGCGTGVLFAHILEKIGSHGKIVGIDYSPGMLKEAKDKLLSKAGSVSTANVLLAAGDAGSLPVKEASFEVVTCFAAFAHFEDKGSALLEIERLLKPGGRVYIIHLLGREELAKHHRRTGGPFVNDVLPENRQMERMLHHAGFIDIEITDSASLYLAKAEKPGGHR